MPPIKKVLKNCCPLCDEVAPLTHRYDVCTPCHQDLVSEKLTESEPDPDSSDDESDSVEDSLSDQEHSETEEKHSVVDSKENLKDDSTGKVYLRKPSNLSYPTRNLSLFRSDSNIVCQTTSQAQNASTSQRNKQTPQERTEL